MAGTTKTRGAAQSGSGSGSASGSGSGSRSASVPAPAAGSTPRKSARERLLASANELFYAEGVQSVGIDRVIEHAGVAKASLYNLFGSKEELVQAYLQHRHAGTTSRLEAAINTYDDPRDRLLSVFEAQGRLFQNPAFNGCAFMSASAEAAPGSLVQKAADEFRTWIRSMFTDLARAAGAPDAEKLARQLHLIYDGAIMTARMDHDATIATEARDAAAALLDAALAAAPANAQ